MVNEEKIINDIKNGIDRYEELVRRYHVGLIIHCERLVGDRQDAEDIAQDAFIKAYLSIQKFNPGKARFSTRLYRIATNEAIDLMRKQRRTVHVEDIELLAEATMPQQIEEEERRAIRKAVQTLSPPEYKTVVEDYYWHGMSYEDIASDLNVPLNTVRTWLHRAKMKLKEQIL